METIERETHRKVRERYGDRGKGEESEVKEKGKQESNRMKEREGRKTRKQRDREGPRDRKAIGEDREGKARKESNRAGEIQETNGGERKSKVN